jgi:hypothetical protein
MRIILFFLIVSILSSCGSSAIRHSENYERTINKSGITLILPPSVEVNSIDLGYNKQRMHDYEVYLGDLIKERVAIILEKLNLKVSILNAQKINEKNLYPDLLKIRDSYYLAITELFKDKDKAINIINNIDSATVLFQQTSDKSDILVFVDYFRDVKSNESRTFDFVTNTIFSTLSGYNTYRNTSDDDNTVIIIGFVEANTGKVLWINSGTTTKGLGESIFKSSNSRKDDIKALDEIFSRLLANFMDKKLL